MTTETEQPDNSTPSAALAVDHVFKVLGATYGAAWDRSLGNAPIQDVKTVWGDALSDFMHTKDARSAISWALKNLPDTTLPPNSRQFRSLCRNAPSKAPVMLPAPVVNPEIAAKVLEGLSASPVKKEDYRERFRRILADEKAGVRRSPTVLQMARNGLGMAHA
jgi:hypothetical protein